MVYSVLQTSSFARWHKNLRNVRAKIAIARRVDRAAAGNPGDVKSVGGGISEMRLDVGSGYRVYFTFRNETVIILLAGGDKSTQPADIQTAKMLAKRFDENE